MQKKTKQIILSPQWDKLMNDSLMQLSKQIPECNNFNMLIRIINCVVSVSARFSSQVTLLLKLCRTQLEPMIPECKDINLLVKGIKAIAKTMRLLRHDWSDLLDDCCNRINVLLPECKDTDTIIRALNCMTRIAPLIGKPVEPEEKDEISPLHSIVGDTDNNSALPNNSTSIHTKRQTTAERNCNAAKSGTPSDEKPYTLSDWTISPLGRPMTEEDLEKTRLIEERLKKM